MVDKSVSQRFRFDPDSGKPYEQAQPPQMPSKGLSIVTVVALAGTAINHDFPLIDAKLTESRHQPFPA
jgi:hypothetical protein